MGFCSNPKSFWKFVRNARTSDGIPNTVSLEDTSVTGSMDVANLFSEFFASVYTTTTVSAFSPTSSCLSYDIPRNCYLLINNVEHSLSKLRGISAVGDFLYNLKSFLAYSLWLLFRRSLNESIYPDLFKLSSITPTLKKDDTSLENNYYRPIFIIFHVAKLFESIVLHSIQ